MKCPRCGKELSEKAKFCRFCGNRIEVANGSINAQELEHVIEPEPVTVMAGIEPEPVTVMASVQETTSDMQAEPITVMAGSGFNEEFVQDADILQNQTNNNAVPKIKPASASQSAGDRNLKKKKVSTILLIVVAFLGIMLVLAGFLAFVMMKDTINIPVISKKTEKAKEKSETASKESEDIVPSEEAISERLSEEEIEKILLPIDELMDLGASQIESDEELAEGIKNLSQVIEQYREAAKKIKDDEIIKERLDYAFSSYADGILNQVNLLDSQSVAEGVGDRYSQMVGELSEAIKLGEELCDDGYEINADKLKETCDLIKEEYPKIVIEEFNKFAGEKLTENGTWSRTEAWNLMSSTYDCGMFEEDDLDDPIRLRYAYALAYFIQRQNEKDLADKLITPAAAAERIASQMKEMDYSPLQLAYYIRYRKEAGLDCSEAEAAYKDVIGYIKNEEGLSIGKNIPLELFWYFSDIDDESTRVDDTNGLTAEARQWVRNRISSVGF